MELNANVKENAIIYYKARFRNVSKIWGLVAVFSVLLPKSVCSSQRGIQYSECPLYKMFHRFNGTNLVG